MGKYKTEANIKEVLEQISSKLSEVEVKGNSVELIFASRILLKKLYDSIEEIEKNEKEE